MKTAALRCQECNHRTIKISAEGFHYTKKKHVVYIFGRYCKTCRKISIDPEFKKLKIVYEKIGDQDAIHYTS